MSFSVTKHSRDICDYIEGVVDTASDIASVETTYAPGSRLTVLDSGDTYVLSGKKWKLLPTIEERCGKLPREISISAGDNTTLVVKKTGTLAGELDDDETITNGSIVYRGDVISITLTCETNYTGNVFVNGQELTLTTGVGTFVVGIGSTHIESIATAVPSSDSSDSNQQENTQSSDLTPFQVGETEGAVLFNGNLTDEEIQALVQAEEHGTGLLEVNIPNYAQFNAVYCGNFDNVGEEWIGVGISAAMARENVIWSAKDITADGHTYTKGWQATNQSMTYGFKWDNESKVVTMPQSAEIVSFNANFNGSVFGKVEN